MLIPVSETCAATATLRVLRTTVALGLALLPLPAAAQEPFANIETPANPGPIELSSALSLQTRYDDNVFRDATDAITDTITTFGASTGVQGGLRRLGVSASGSAEWVHFDKLASERGPNVGAALRLDFLFNRFVPYVSGSHLNSRNRQSPEIDTRPRSHRSTVGVGSIVPLGAKTSLDVSAMRSIDGYVEEATFDGVNLSTALDRVSDRFSLSFRREVTPLTRLAVTGEVHRYQFNVSSARSADDIRLSTGFNSDGFINGSARVGFRVLKPHDTSLSEARGFFAFVGTSMTLADRVRIGLVGERDLVPSYREEVAYYATHGYAASVTYTLRDSLSFSGQFGQRFVDYREAQGAIVLTTDEMGVDRETRYESGILYQVRESFGIEFSATYTERESTSASRRFDGMRVGGGIRYGF